MRILHALFSPVIVCGLLAIRMATAADSPPAWAYPPNNPDYKPHVVDGKPVRVPDSTAGYTWSQLRDRFIAPVWHPSDHGALPDIVANGRKPGVFACGFCHRATGPGGPENADLAGLPIPRGFEPRILAALVAPLQPWCVFLLRAYYDCLNRFCAPCSALVDVTVHLLEKYLQPCCCRNKQLAGLRK
jgi:hypothetical protein